MGTSRLRISPNQGGEGARRAGAPDRPTFQRGARRAPDPRAGSAGRWLPPDGARLGGETARATLAIGTPAGAGVHRLGEGRPLAPGERHDLEGRLGFDFGRVRIHADARAGEEARRQGARAYTVGPHVVINPRHFSPGTSAGRALLGHELAHVIQQSRSPARTASASADQERRFEREAEQAAVAIEQGRSFRIREQGPVPGLQRDLEEMSFTDRLLVGVLAGLPALADGFAIMLTAIMLTILGILLIVALLSALFPGVGELITAALATTGATYLLGLLASLGLVHALTELFVAGSDLLTAAESAENRAQLEEAGARWGARSGSALAELLAALLAIPAIRGLRANPAVPSSTPGRPVPPPRAAEIPTPEAPPPRPTRPPASPVPSPRAAEIPTPEAPPPRPTRPPASPVLPPRAAEIPTPQAPPPVPTRSPAPAVAPGAAVEAEAAGPAASGASRVVARIQAARGQLTDLFTALLRSGPGAREIFRLPPGEGGGPSPAALAGIQAERVGSEVRVMYDTIHVSETLRGQGLGTTLQQTFEQAAVAAARQAGASQVRVMVRTIINPAWAARLEALGYARDFVELADGTWSSVLARVIPVQ